MTRITQMSTDNVFLVCAASAKKVLSVRIRAICVISGKVSLPARHVEILVKRLWGVGPKSNS
jgi:hypothetical protein